MSYRDDNDELRTRVAALERDLARAEHELGRLRGEKQTPDAGTAPASMRAFGIPVRFERDELLPFEISEHGYEQIAAVLRRHLALQVTQIGRTLHAPGNFSLEREAGGTRIRMTGDWSTLRAGVVAGAFMALLVPGVPLMALFAGAASLDMPLVALQGVWAIPATMVGGGWLMRKLGARQAANGIRRFEGAFAAVIDTARANAVDDRAAPVDARVDASVAQSDDLAVSDESSETSSATYPRRRTAS